MLFGSLGANSVLSHPSEPTVFENYVQDIYVDDQLIELSLWDTAGMTSWTLFGSAPLSFMHVGQEEFDRLRSLSYAETHVVLICFSVSVPTSSGCG